MAEIMSFDRPVVYRGGNLRRKSSPVPPPAKHANPAHSAIAREVIGLGAAPLSLFRQLSLSPRPSRIEQADHQPDRDDDDRAGQERAAELAEIGEAIVDDAADETLDARNDVARLDAEHDQEHADDERDDDEPDRHRSRRAAKETLQSGIGHAKTPSREVEPVAYVAEGVKRGRAPADAATAARVPLWRFAQAQTYPTRQKLA